MTDAIIDATNIDTSLFSYSPPKAHASGGKVVNLYNKNTKESLTMSTPLILTWGAQEGQEQGTKKPTGKWTMALQFPTKEYSNPDLEGFFDSMKRLDQQVKEDALKNSKEWFGKEIKSMDVIEEKFNAMLKYPKKEKGGIELDYNKPPTLTVKIPQWSGVWKPEIYDEDGEPLYINGKVNAHLSPLEYLKPKTHIICLLQCGGLWFVNGKISITWNLKQAIVQKPKPTMEGTCFLRPKAADKEKMKALPPPEDDIDPDGAATATLVSDDEGDHEIPPPPVAPAPAPAPKPVEEPVEEEVKPKKKITRKPKADA